jgi:hypothetical protein
MDDYILKPEKIGKTRHAQNFVLRPFHDFDAFLLFSFLRFARLTADTSTAVQKFRSQLLRTESRHFHPDCGTEKLLRRDIGYSTRA